jgi:hypothetical protein
MPDRWVRFNLQNASGQTIKKIFEHHCHGNWTDGWAPPNEIPNNTGASFQAENNAGDPLPAAEGYVKFGIPYRDKNDKPQQDELYLYWNAPFIGEPWVNGSVSTQPVQPDCDFEKQRIDLQSPPLPSNWTIFENFEGSAQGGALFGTDLLHGGVPFVGGPVLATLIFTGFSQERSRTFDCTLVNKPNSIGGFSHAWGFDPRLGLRRLIPDAPVISLRKYFGIRS